MPRSFLVKRRKSADANSSLDSVLLEKTQDPFSNTAEQKMFVPSSQGMTFHPQSFLCNTLQRNHHWNQTNTPCSPCRSRTFPHSSETWVKFPTRNKCINAHCCECIHRKLEEPQGCLCCLASQKYMSDVTQVHVPPWHRNMNNNYDSHYHGIFLPKYGPCCSKSLPPPMERLHVHAREVANRSGHDLTACHIGNDTTRFGKRLRNNLKVVRKEEALLSNATVRDKKKEINDELPAKRMKTAPVDKDDVLGKEVSKETSIQQNETQSNSSAEETKVDDLIPEENIKQELPMAKNVQDSGATLSDKETNRHEKESKLNCKEKDQLNSQEKPEKQATDIQRKAPTHGTRKSQQTKSKKGLKDNNIKPYNTRVVTSRRPIAYSSDFVLPEEEDWRQDKDSYQMKGRQRTKLNRLLANEHERRRVAQLNSAYQDLRQLIPGYQCDTKLPKIKILKYAIDYIAHLDDILAAEF